MAIKVISIYDIVEMSQNEVHNLYHDVMDEFEVTFDDGSLMMRGTEIRFSRIVLEYWLALPTDIPILRKYVVAYKRTLNPHTHLALCDLMYRDYIAAYGGTEKDINDTVMNKHIYERIVGAIYHFCIEHLDAYVYGSCSMDLINIINHPPIKEANAKLLAIKGNPTPEQIAECHNVVEKELNTAVELCDNPLVVPVRCGATRMGSTLMMVSAVGNCTDIDSSLFKYTYRNSFYRGGAELWEYAMESRNASIASLYNDLIIPVAQYGNRRYQLIAQSVRAVVPGDCNTPHVDRTFVVDKKKLLSLEGMLYKAKSGWRTIANTDIELIGQDIEFRSPLVCTWRSSRNEVCSTCYGTLFRSLIKYREGTSANAKYRNVGHIAAINVGEQNTSAVLARKHANATSVASTLRLNIEQQAYMRVGDEGRHIYFHDNQRDSSHLNVVLYASHVGQLHDYCNGVVKDVIPSTATGIEEFMVNDTESGDGNYMVDVSIGAKERKGNLTLEALDYVKERGWTYGPNKEHIISLDAWDITKPFLRIPQVEFSPPEFIDHIVRFTLGPSKNKGVDDHPGRRLNGYHTPMEAADALYEVLSSRLTIHYCHVSIIVLSLTAQDPDLGDYRLPYPRHKGKIIIEAPILENSSMGMSMAYEDQHQILSSPSSYVNTRRRSHPLDSLLLSKVHGNPKTV